MTASIRWTAVPVLLVLLAPVAATSAEAPPDIQASAYVLYDPGTTQELAARAPGVVTPMASTTKLMTAIVTLDKAKLNERATVPPGATIGGSTAGLVVGEQLSVGDLLTALLVGSGNDSAITLATHVSGSEEAFVEAMNVRARELGLENTSFANPHGLDQEGHFSTARDLITLATAAMSRPPIRERVDDRRASIPGRGGPPPRVLVSKNDLLERDAFADGIKTGFTNGAGHALVARSTRDGVGSLYLSMLGSPSERQRAEDAKRMLDWGFRQFAYGTLVVGGRTQATSQVVGWGGKRVDLVAPESLSAPFKVGVPVTRRIVAPAEVAPPIVRGQELGRIELRQGNRLLGERDLVASTDIDSPSPWRRIGAATSRLLPF